MITPNTQTVFRNEIAIAHRDGNFSILKNLHVALLMHRPFSFKVPNRKFSFLRSKN